MQAAGGGKATEVAGRVRERSQRETGRPCRLEDRGRGHPPRDAGSLPKLLEATAGSPASPPKSQRRPHMHAGQSPPDLYSEWWTVSGGRVAAGSARGGRPNLWVRDKPRGRGTPPLLLRAFLVQPAGARAPSRRQGVQGARCRPEWMGQGRSGVGWGSWKLASDTGKDTGVQGEKRKRAGWGAIGPRGTPRPGLCCSTKVRIKHVTCPPSASSTATVRQPLRGCAGTQGLQKSQGEDWCPLQVPLPLSHCGNRREQTFSVFPTITRHLSPFLEPMDVS